MDSFGFFLFGCFSASLIVISIKVIVLLLEEKEKKDFETNYDRLDELIVLEELNIIASDEKKELKELREKENLDEYGDIIGSSDEYYDWRGI
jgi:hypothetical protein